MTQELSKLPADQAKAALASAVDQGSGLDLMTLSTVMVQSGFFKNAESVAQGVVKILAGRELGFPAIASMRHIYVHDGHIGLQATLIATKIRQSGTYDYRIVESSDTKCEIEFLRLVKPDNEWRVEGKAGFTIEEAKRAGLIKEKSAWMTYPSDLLFARAMTRGQRRYCPDVFGQTVYSEEEIHEIAAAEPTLVGGQTLEERMAEMMPREKVVAPGASEPDASNRGPSPESTATAPAVLVRPLTQGELDGGSAEVPVQESLPSAEREQPAKPNAYEPMTDAEIKALPPRPKKLTFTVGQQKFETNGITRAQLMELFKICPRVGKKCGAAKPAEILRKEFGLEHRVDLTEEQAERYYIRMREMMEGT